MALDTESPVFLSSSECLAYIFKQPIDLPTILKGLLGEEKSTAIAKKIIQVELGGAWMTGSADAKSDLDFSIQVKSLIDLDDQLTEWGITHIYRKVEPTEIIVGNHDHIMIHPGDYKGIRIEISAEERPPLESRTIILSRFTSHYYLDHPEEHERAVKLKWMAEQNIPGGYRKSIFLIYEEMMKHDLNYCPVRIDHDPLGKKAPRYESKLDPTSWIYLRETLGTEKARKIAHQLDDKVSILA